MDPQVTCPRCHERQPLTSPEGYTCISCGTRWTFAACRSCGDRFHMDPATTSWRCPSCGTQNGPARAPAKAPSSSPASPKRSAPSLRPGNDRTTLVVVVVVAVVAIAVLWLLLEHRSSSPPATSPSATASITAAQALSNLCHDIPIDQNLRVDALRRTADQVRIDAKALRLAGNADAAQKATAVALAMDSLADALNTQGDTATATRQLHDAIDAVSTLCQGG